MFGLYNALNALALHGSIKRVLSTARFAVTHIHNNEPTYSSAHHPKIFYMLKITETRQTAYIQQGSQSGERVTTYQQNLDVVDQIMSQGMKAGLSQQLSAQDPNQAGSATVAPTSPTEVFANTQSVQDVGLSFDIQDKLSLDQELLKKEKTLQAQHA